MLKYPTFYLLALLTTFLALGASGTMTKEFGILFSFKGEKRHLFAPLRLSKHTLHQKGGLSPAALDSASNIYYLDRQYVEIIRQDDPFQPHSGIALGFEFDELAEEFPYSPAFVTIQIKDFTWGGVEFSAGDTLNYTGVSNDVSDDVSLQVDSYQNDTITGHFSGLLLNGAGGMALLDSGIFRIRLLRKE